MNQVAPISGMFGMAPYCAFCPEPKPNPPKLVLIDGRQVCPECIERAKAFEQRLRENRAEARRAERVFAE